MWLYKHNVYILLQVADPDVPPAHRTFQHIMPLHRSMTSKSKGEGTSLGRQAQGLGSESHGTAAGKEKL